MPPRRTDLSTVFHRWGQLYTIPGGHLCITYTRLSRETDLLEALPISQKKCKNYINVDLQRHGFDHRKIGTYNYYHRSLYPLTGIAIRAATYSYLQHETSRLQDGSPNLLGYEHHGRLAAETCRTET
jgi:hypothetical protein